MADTTASLPASTLPATMPRRRELLFGTAFATAGVSMALIALIGNYIATSDMPSVTNCMFGWVSENWLSASQAMPARSRVAM